MLYSNYCLSLDTPRSQDYLRELGWPQLTLILCLCGISVFTFLIFVEEIWHMESKNWDWRLRRKALICLGIYPVTSLNAMVAILVPRAAGVTDFTVSLYYALCMFMFSQMLLEHFGGKEDMVSRLQEAGDARIQLRSGPLCCCMTCLPKPMLTLKRLVVLEFLVMQFVIFKPVSTFILAIVLADAGPGNIAKAQSGESMDLIIIQVGSALNTISTLIAVWGNIMLFRMSHDSLRSVNISIKFYLIQGCVMLENLQKLFLAILVSLSLLGCQPPLDINATKWRMHHQALIFEMVSLAVIARIYYRHDMRGSVSSTDSQQHLSTAEQAGYGSNAATDFERSTSLSGCHSDTLVVEGVTTTAVENIR